MAPAARPEPPDLAAFLAPYPSPVQETARRLRARVLAVVPQAHEVAWDATNGVSLVYAPTARWQDGICHIAVYAGHVNLGFNQGAALVDPAGVLNGSGAHIRHASFKAEADTAAPWIDDYLDAALAHAGLDRSMGDGGTTVRVSTGPKRRPAG